jgi:hypothetical protein
VHLISLEVNFSDGLQGFVTPMECMLIASDCVLIASLITDGLQGRVTPMERISSLAEMFQTEGCK